LKNYYALLAVEMTATPDEIKRAFRREIARYHPDKVQHLGHEFQEIASVRAAELTEAYRILMDVEARRRYDEGHDDGGRAAPPPRPASTPSGPAAPPGDGAADPAAARPAARPESDAPPPPDARVQAARATTSTFVKKAALAMLRESVTAVAPGATEEPAPGFDLAYVVKPKRALFGKKEPAVLLLATVVPRVDAASVEESWPRAVTATGPDQVACVLLLGSGLASSKDLGTAVADQRRKTRTAVPVIVPVDVRDWDALIPPEVPPIVRAIIQRLRAGKG
jgi:hypothetical protein